MNKEKKYLKYLYKKKEPIKIRELYIIHELILVKILIIITIPSFFNIERVSILCNSVCLLYEVKDFYIFLFYIY